MRVDADPAGAPGLFKFGVADHVDLRFPGGTDVFIDRAGDSHVFISISQSSARGDTFTAVELDDLIGALQQVRKALVPAGDTIELRYG